MRHRDLVQPNGTAARPPGRKFRYRDPMHQIATARSRASAWIRHRDPMRLKAPPARLA